MVLMNYRTHYLGHIVLFIAIMCLGCLQISVNKNEKSKMLTIVVLVDIRSNLGYW